MHKNLVCLSLLCALATATCFAEEPAAAKVRKLLDDLKSEDFNTRDAATKAVGLLPVEAVSLLKDALAEPNLDPEIKQRLPKALEALAVKHAKELFRKRIELRHAWLKKNFQDAYEQVGSKSEKWDTPAREALRLAVIDWANDFDRDYNEEAHVYRLTTQAIAAGCDDPLIEFLHAFSEKEFNKPAFIDYLNATLKAASHLNKSNYPEFLRFYLSMQGANALLNVRPAADLVEKKKRDLVSYYHQILEKLEGFLKDPEIADDWIKHIVAIGVELGMQEDPDRKKHLDALGAILQRGRPRSVLSRVFRGEGYMDYAWDARGSGWANSVTEDGWKLMKERLAVAEEELTAAWALDPTHSAAADGMVHILIGIGGGRERMEEWFKRAMAVNPYDATACSYKVNYLEPKWHGSNADLLAFGRECLKTGDWYSDVPFTLADVHILLARNSGDVSAYFRKPEVWKDMEEVYETGLKARPKDSQLRTRYLKMAMFAEKWELADRLFKLLGDEAYVSAFATAQEFKQMKTYTAKMLEKMNAAKTK